MHLRFRNSGLLLFLALCLGSLGGCAAPPSTEETTDTAESEIRVGSRTCRADHDCNFGVDGLGVVCNQGKCVEGCNGPEDCPGGGTCETRNGGGVGTCTNPYPKIGTRCDQQRDGDAFCAGRATDGTDATQETPGEGDDAVEEEQQGVGRVCSTLSGHCILGCHTQEDCPEGSDCKYVDGGRRLCVKAGEVTPAPDTQGPGAAVGSGGCKPVVYPSITLMTKPDPRTADTYRALKTSCVAPKCFLDVTDLQTPSGATVDVHVNLSRRVTLYELVRTTVDPGGTGHVASPRSTMVLVDPRTVAHLETMRASVGNAPIFSGFRSPSHQLALCRSICGCAQCVSNGRGGNRCGNAGKVTCARNSRHMWGAAADLAMSYSNAAKRAGFPFVFEERGGTGPHLHVDERSCR